MAYSNKLRPRKKIKKCIFFGKFGKFDCTEGVKWEDFTEEMLISFANLHDAKTVGFHLIGEVPKAEKTTKKLSKKPSTDELQPEE